MGLGNTAPVIASLSVSPLPAPASTAVTVTCAATDGSAVTRLVVAVSGGLLPNGTLSQEVGITAGQAVSGSIAWTVGAPGAYQVTCAATDDGLGGFGTTSPITTTSAPLAVDVVAAGNPPPVVASVTPSATRVFAGSKVHLVAVASGTGALSWAWTATGGSVEGTGPEADWVAPAAAGTYALTLTVTDGAGVSAQRSADVAVVWAENGPQTQLPGFYPERLAVDAAGTRYVTDARAGAVVVFSKAGLRLRSIPVDGLPSGIAVARGGDRILVGDATSATVRVYDASGQRLAVVGAGALARPLALALGASGRLYVADYQGASQPGRVQVFDAAGQLAASWPFAAGYPTGVALDPAGTKVFVASSAGAVVSYDTAGTPLATVATFGSGPGQVTRPGGLAVGFDSNLYVVDSFQGHLAAFAPDGSYLANVGDYGSGPGQLNVPVDVAADADGQLVVSSTMDSRLVGFLLRGAAAPGCAGDSDCDGMPDDWELANGLDPFDGSDAAKDADADGLANLEEFRWRTNPRRADTDGDGSGDGAEVAAGTDPTDPNSRPAAVAVVASGPANTLPGLARLSASVQGQGSCTVAWTQTAGVPVALRGAAGLTPSFVGRAAGSYRFQAVARCGAAASAPAEVAVEVLNAAPRADAGSSAAFAAGSTFDLDGSASTDANGDPLSLTWDQTLGAPIAAAQQGPWATATAPAPGLYAFEASAADVAGAQASAAVHVVVLGPGSAGPVAVAPGPLAGRAGEPVQLDGSDSYGEEFHWEQLEGPAVALAPGARRPVFTPPAAGRYAFALSVSQGLLRSPPTRVEVFVAAAGGQLPTAAVGAATLDAVAGAPLELDGSGSRAGGGEAVAFEWRQLSGPAAGLTDASRAVATLVPFDPGVYVFELVVTQGEAPSLPARVTVVARQPGVPLPVAHAMAPIQARTGKPVLLSAAGSQSGDGGALRFRWRQVGGPWVALAGSRAATASFETSEEAFYAFELVVEDGRARSAAARVDVAVTDREHHPRPEPKKKKKRCLPEPRRQPASWDYPDAEGPRKSGRPTPGECEDGE